MTVGGGARLSRAALWLSVSRTITALAMLMGVRAILVRTFDEADFGRFQKIMLLTGLLPLVLMAGVPKGIYYFMSLVADRRHFLVTALLLLAGLGLAGGAAVVVLAPGLAVRADRNPYLAAHAAIIGGHVALQVLWQFADPFLITTGRTRILCILIGASGAAGIAGVAAGAMAGTVGAVLTGLLAAYALQVAALLWLLARTPPDEVPPTPHCRTLITYILPIAATGLVVVLGRNADKLIGVELFPAEAYAVYSVGAMELPFVASVVYGAFSVLMPRWVRFLAGGNAAEFLESWRECTRKLALVVTPLFFGFAVFAGEFIAWLNTDRMAAATPIFRVYLLLLPIRILGLDVVLQSMNRNRDVLAGVVLGTVASFTFSILLFSLTGRMVFAAAGAVGAAWMFEFGWLAWRVRRASGIGWRGMVPGAPLARILAAGVLASGPAALALLPGLPRLVTMLAGGTIYVAVYGCLLRVFGALTQDDLALARSLLPAARRAG